MSEEMKALIALAAHLGLEIRCTSRDGTDIPVDSARFMRNAAKEYTYTIRPVSR